MANIGASAGNLDANMIITLNSKITAYFNFIYFIYMSPKIKINKVEDSGAGIVPNSTLS